ncbi:MAG: T9SS type A sorting domain-containing protein [bacterium]
MVRTWVKLNAQGDRELIGVSMTEGVLNNLPLSPQDFTLALPVMGSDTLFNHVFFGWNPAGHPPPGIYTLPHFDFHFVMVRRSEREAVIPGPDPVVLQPDFIPQDYLPDPVAIPNHGVHWHDSTAPEYHGVTFTKTLIYGFYRGNIFFVEPMVTVAHLLTHPHDTLNIKQPMAYLRTGYFPTKYNITHDAGNQIYNIVLQDFVPRTVVLPVELASFISTINKNAVTLNWITASEINNSRFDIERSLVNGQWSTVGSVRGNGTTNSPMNYSFTDGNLNSGLYNYRLKQIDFNGNFEYFNLTNEINIGIPSDYELSQNYPNPFNPATHINFDLPLDGKVSIKLFDISGKEVATIVNEVKTAGYYSINFNASSLSSGVYFYSISANNFTATKKMMVVK